MPLDDDRPIRVLMTADTIGGVWTYALALGRALCEQGVHITLAAMGEAPSAAQAAAAEAIEGLTLHARPYRLCWMEEPWQDVEASREWLRELADEVQPDLVHLNTLAHGAVDYGAAPVLTVGHSCVYSWFDAVHGAPPDEPRWHRYREVVTEGLRGSDVVVGITDAILRQLERFYGPFDRRAVVYNGLDPQPFTADASSPEPPVVLAAGRLWDEAKNVATLADAAEQIRWPVHVAGAQDHPDGGRMELDGVELLGRLDADAMRRAYASAPIYALPARYEPFGLTPVEAALSGCALVLGDIPTLREVWGDAAVFVAPDDADALAAAINGLIDDPARLRAAADAAERKARTYSVAAMTRGYLDLYGELLERAAGASAPSDDPIEPTEEEHRCIS